MPAVPAKVRDRLVPGIKRFQGILQNSKSRDVNESDTVTIIKDMLADVFGFDKYADITSEYAIKGTYVDLATRIDGHLVNLIEVKAIGLELKDAFVKQAVDYAANEGVEWVILTNAVSWRVYKVHFTQPIEAELVFAFEFLDINPKTEAHLETLFMLSREGYTKSLLGEYHTQRQALNKYFVAALLSTDPVVDLVRKLLRKMSPDVKIDSEQILEVISDEVLKRDVIEGEKADEAVKKVAKFMKKLIKQPRQKTGTPSSESDDSDEESDVDDEPKPGTTAPGAVDED